MRIILALLVVLLTVIPAFAATVTVNLNSVQGPVTYRATGHTHGINATTPSALWVPLKVVSWRGADTNPEGASVDAFYPRVFPGSTVTFVPMDSLGAVGGANQIARAQAAARGEWSSPVGSPATSVDTIYTNLVVKYRDKPGGAWTISHDLWNEPDHISFWPGWGCAGGDAGATCRANQFYATYKHLYDLVRTLRPGATIVGPSSCCGSPNGWTGTTGHANFIKNFLAYCNTNNCLPNRVTWHENGNSNFTTAAHVAEIRAWMVANLDSGVALPVELNEMMWQNNSWKPSEAVTYINQAEEALIFAGGKSWFGPDVGAQIGGLITTGLQPRSIWWVFQKYGEMLGNIMTATTTQQEVDAVAAWDGTTVRTLVSNHTATGGAHTVTFSNIPTALVSGGQVRITTQAINNSEQTAVVALPAATSTDVTVTGNAASVSPTIGAWGAVSVTVTRITGAPIANSFPGDVNIESHPDFILKEMFEDTVADVSNRFTGSSTISSGFVNGSTGQSRNNAGMSLATDAPPGSPGTKSLHMTGIGGTNTGGHLFRNIDALDCNPECYIRYYVKYGSVTPYHHAGVWLIGQNPASNFLPSTNCDDSLPVGNSASCLALQTGATMFYVGTEPGSGGNPPTSFDMYTAWMEMRESPPAGQPVGSRSFFGNTFVPNSLQIIYNQWHLVEVRIKMNSIGQANGELQLWLDGTERVNLIAGLKGTWSDNIWTTGAAGPDTFPGFRWRTDAGLDLNGLWLNFLTDGLANGAVATMRYDHLVVARSRIGALVPAPSGSGTVTIASTTSDDGSSATAAVGHTPSGTNRILTATITRANAGSVTGCTFDGSGSPVALTFIGGVTPSDGLGRVEKWSLINPAASPGTVSCPLTGSADWVIGVRSYSGALQTMSTGDFNFTSATGTSTAPSVTITTATNQMVEDGLSVVTGSQTVTPGPGQTQNYNIIAGAVVLGAGSTETATAGSTVMSWTISASRSWALSAIRILPTGDLDIIAPNAPTNLMTSLLSTSTVGLTCTLSSSTDVVNYRFKRCSGVACTPVEVGTAGPCAFTHTGLAPNTLYRHMVSAWDGVNFSTDTSILETTTLPAQTLFVRFVDQQPDGANQETGFVINRKEPGGVWAERTITGPSAGSGLTVTFQDTTAPLPAACYQVAADNNVGTSAALGGDAGVCFTPTPVILPRRVKGWRR